jgi:purine-binding chemotaxis protein CheW
MVDMVEARKRAKAKLQQGNTNLAEKLEIPESTPPKAKPVLRSEPQIVEEPPAAYFPIQTPEEPPRPAALPVHVPALPEPVPLERAAEDQVDFLQRLMLEEDDEEESEHREELAPEEEMEALVFQLGSEHYGMDIQQIAEIIRFQEPTEVPNTIRFLDGIISLRGRMIPVINGRKRLGHEPSPPDKKTRIIVLQDNTEFHGILVDSASQVLRLPRKNIEPTPSVVVGVDAEFINGVCEHKSQLIILLNLERFLQFQ